MYTLHRGIYSVQEKNNSVNSPSAPTASISSHSHSQSVLNVSRAPSLSVSLCVCLCQCQALTTQMYLPPRRCSNSLYFPDSEIVPRLCVCAAHRRRCCQGGLGDVVLLFSHSIQIEKCLSLSQRNSDGNNCVSAAAKLGNNSIFSLKYVVYLSRLSRRHVL